MSTEKKLLILMAVIIVAFLLPIVYMGIAITSIEKDTKLNVTASNGVEFKGVYTLHSFPDESYDAYLKVLGESDLKNDQIFELSQKYNLLENINYSRDEITREVYAQLLYNFSKEYIKQK